MRKFGFEEGLNFDEFYPFLLPIETWELGPAEAPAIEAVDGFFRMLPKLF